MGAASRSKGETGERDVRKVAPQPFCRATKKQDVKEGQEDVKDAVKAAAVEGSTR